MRWWLSVWITVLVGLSLVSGVRAQSSPELEKVHVAVWPEYDKPGVLVIYRITLSSKASLPADVTFRIPQAVGKPNAVAMQDVDGSLVSLNYTTAADGEWNKIRFTTPAQDFQIEYYDTRLTKEGAKRSFEYRWPGDYTVNSLAVQVQQPLKATNMQITPNLGAGQQQSDGLTYYETTVGALKSGTGFTIRLSYDKSDDSLSHVSEPVSPAASINQNTPGRQTFQEVLPWILAAVGVLLIGGGGLWYWQSGREPRPVEVKRRHAPIRRDIASESEGSSAAGAIYCHQCGRRANSGDVFCRTCGTKLRS